MSLMKPVKVGFVLLSNSRRPLPSTRIAVLNMFPYLGAANYEPHVCFEPDGPAEQPSVPGLAERLEEQGIDIVVFQKVHGASVLSEAKRAAAKGIKTIYAVCDFIDNEMAAATDATIVVTDYLKALYNPALHYKIHVVHDGIEHPEVAKENYGPDVDVETDARLNAGLVTASSLTYLPVIGEPPSFLRVTVVGRYPSGNWVLRGARAAYEQARSAGDYRRGIDTLRQVVSGRFRTVPWGPNTVYEIMIQADVGIIPIDMRHEPLPGQAVSSWQVKSENRLTMKMAVGLPVVASPVPSYLPVIDQGKNGFIAETRADWLACLKALRNPRLRREIGRNARDSVLTRFSKDDQAVKFIRVLEHVRSLH
jgi:glycosyltransferase involved in cell wall biosynthesis